MVQLRRRLVVPRAPSLSAVDRDHGALIGDEQDDVRIAGVDPEILIIVAAWRALEGHPVLSAVDGLHRDGGGYDHDVRIFRIDNRIRQITPTDSRSRTSVVRDLGPR